MKLFKINNINHAKYCPERFSLDMPSDLRRKEATKLESKFTDLLRESVVGFFLLFCLLVLLYITLVVYFTLLLPCFGEIKPHERLKA